MFLVLLGGHCNVLLLLLRFGDGMRCWLCWTWISTFFYFIFACCVSVFAGYGVSWLFCLGVL